jgi:hypothetical protein
MLSLDPVLQELYPRMVAERGTVATSFDKNLPWDELHITKKGIVCQEEKITRYGGPFSRHPVRTGTKRFRSGMRMTQDRTFLFTSRPMGFLYPLLRADQPLVLSIRTRSTARSAQIGMYWIIRASIEGIRG